METVSLVGLSSGALLAAEALQRVPGLAALVLWDPPLSGRRFLRRQRSLHELTLGASAEPTDGIRLLSLSLHRTTAEWLEGCEITPDSLSNKPTLVLGRHADQAGQGTRRFIAALPAGVDYVPIHGQEEFLDVESAIAKTPEHTVELIVNWFDHLLPTTSVPVNASINRVAQVGRSLDGSVISERISRFGSHDLFVIETVRVGTDPIGVVVMQPAAAEHRVGPGRLQVLAARELAAQGYRALRFDRRVTGDSTEVSPVEPSFVLAEEWVRDAEELVAEYASDLPLALVGLCSGAWISARIANRTAARLTVLLDVNYFRTLPLEANEYAGRALRAQRGEVSRERLRGRLVRALPGWIRRMAAPIQIFQDAEVLLSPATRRTGSTLALLFTPEDEANFRRLRGQEAVGRLRARGADIRVMSYPFGDHALLGEEIRAAVLSDLLTLVAEAIPGVAASARDER